MLIFTNVNDAYNGLLEYVQDNGVIEDSRNGRVLTVTRPLLIEIKRPEQRVLFDTTRRPNPFFHLAEAVWMMKGRNDVAGVAKYAKQMQEYSDDGLTFNAAYGYRWRNHFGYDQVAEVIDKLKRDRTTRQAVIGMWDPYNDLTDITKDRPCNTQLMFRVVGDALTMTSTNRSNDLIWGLCGANAVHLTVLQECIAAAINADIGSWYHMTNNLHVYEHHWPLLDAERDHIGSYPLGVSLCNGSATVNYIGVDFLRYTADRVAEVWDIYKKSGKMAAIAMCDRIEARDWRIACRQWLGGCK